MFCWKRFGDRSEKEEMMRFTLRRLHLTGLDLMIAHGCSSACSSGEDLLALVLRMVAGV